MADQITKRSENYSQWYNDLVVKADLAEQSPVRGCMVIKPYGYAIWEKMQHILDAKFKETGAVNAYFPLFIPKSFFSREAEHVAGFAKECAVVTHHRLMNDPDGNGVVVDPSSKLEEELIVRPTSETIIWSTYKNWIKSWRDLPIMCNQWANVVRWEMRTRLFLRTAEFLWQEGHTIHETPEEAIEETERMLNVYADFCEQQLAMPVVKGRKTESDKFAGAEATYAIEALMHDGKALQAGTSHYFGDGFAKAFDITYTGRDNKLAHPFQTSWGVTTRLIGAVIMTHGDDNGLVLPPAVAPVQVVIVPIAQHKEGVLDKANELYNTLKNAGIRVKLDDSEQSPGWKFAQYEMKGVPVRLEIGPKDIENDQCVLVTRHNREKVFCKLGELVETVNERLQAVHDGLYAKALENRERRTYVCKTLDEITKALEEKGDGFVKAMWCGDEACEDKVKELTGVGSRCIPFEQEEIADTCVCCGKPAKHMVLWGKAY